MDLNGERAMEKLLNRLFDYQKFENNPNLASVISAVENKYSITEERRLLSEDELTLVSAAGQPFYEGKGIIKKEQENGKK